MGEVGSWWLPVVWHGILLSTGGYSETRNIKNVFLHVIWWFKWPYRFRRLRGFLWLNINSCDNLSDHMTLSGQFKQLVSLSCTSWFFQTIMKPLNLFRDTHLTHKRRRFLVDSLNFITFAFAQCKAVLRSSKSEREIDNFLWYLPFILWSFSLSLGVNRPFLIFSACSLIFFAFA